MKYFFNVPLSLTLLLFISCSSDKEKNYIEVSGNIEALSTLISSKVSGEVLDILKQEGDKVSIGDTLLIIDPSTYKIKLREAEAMLVSAEAQYNLVKQGARREDIKQAEQLLIQREIDLRSAENDKVRFENLFNAKAISKKQLEDAIWRYELALAQYNSAKENLTKIKNISRPEELKQAEANVEKIKANVDLIRKSINDCYVISPINGIITKKFIEKGEVVTNFSSLCKISDLSKVELTVYINEKDLVKVKTGQSVDVKIDALPNKIFKGKVTYITPEAEFTPKNIQTKEERTKLVFAVKITIDNPNYELKPGIPADAFINIRD